MATDPLYRPITVDEFLAMDFKTDRKFELSNGVIHMMTGGTELHSWVQGNIHVWLRGKLRGSGCYPHGPDMGVRIGDVDVRYPDVSVSCAPRPEDGSEVLVLEAPIVVIEVLSPSTTTYDQGTKLENYKAVTSIELIAFVDPVNELVRTVQRMQPSGWLDTTFAAVDLDLAPLDLTIPHAEIFARD